MLSYKKAHVRGLIDDVKIKRMAVVVLLKNAEIRPNNNLCAYECDNTQKSFPVVYRNILKKLRDAGCTFAIDDAPAGALSYKLAKEKNLLRPVDFKRLAVIWLIHCEEIKMNGALVQIAADEAGNSPGSFQVLTRKVINDFRNAGCAYTETEAAEYGATVPSTPRTPGSTRRGRKCKAETLADYEMITSSPKKRTVKAENKMEKLQEREDGETEEVKMEVMGEDVGIFDEEWPDRQFH